MPVSRHHNWRSFPFRLFVISLVVGIAGAMSGAALAKDPKIAISKRDNDGDGRVGRDEWKESGETFAKIDANLDNFLTIDEFSAYFSTLEGSGNSKKKAVKGKGAPSKSRNPKTVIKNMDTDGDGKLTRGEWTGQKKYYNQIDANGDGHLTLTELTVHYASLANSGGGKNSGAKGKAKKSKTKKTKNPKTMVKNMDKDGDGLIDREEWTGQAAFYDKIDTDRDARLTIAELTVHLAALAKSKDGKKSGTKGKDPKSMIKKMDADDDGLLAREEWTGEKDKFDQFDADQDGRLTAEEIAAGLAAAAESKKMEPKDPEAMIKKFDTDGDSLLTREEWKGKAEAYDKMDADRDAHVTLAELTAHLATAQDSKDGKPKDPNEMIKKMDTDGDGLLARKEWKAEKDKFDQFDANRDGSLTAEEIAAGQSAGQDSKVNLMSAIRNFDKNRDTMLSRDEWTGSEKQFETTDANRDGQLTVAEMAAALVKNLDKDGNGKLSISEAPFPKEKFDILDKSGDGLLSAEEFTHDIGWSQATK
jgi:Ca2+-binding EF-hand superfamily protein